MPSNAHLPDEPFVHLIGGNHAIQFKSAVAQMFGESESVRKKREAFKAHVAETIDKLDIEILAEEFNEEAKGQPDEQEVEVFKENHPVELGNSLEQLSWETVLEQFSKANGIKHRFCDPDSEERKALGIEDPDSEYGRAMREQVWMSRITDCKHRRVLFVCGDTHYLRAVKGGFEKDPRSAKGVRTRRLLTLPCSHSPRVSPRRLVSGYEWAPSSQQSKG